MAELEVSGLSKSFSTRAEPLEILRHVDLRVELGERVAILGQSGCGKSTLLHLIGTLDTPTSGSVTLGGVDPFRLSESELARFRGEQIGFVFQEHHLLPQLTVLENVVLPMVALGRATSEWIERAEQLIDAVGLSGRRLLRGRRPCGGQPG